jgi:hypothetical protein
MDRLLPRLVSAVVLLICLLPRGLAAQIMPVGPAVRSDTLTGLNPSCPQLAVGSDRSFEVVWDYGAFSINTAFGRHFSPAGEPSSDAQVQIGPGGGPYNFVVLDRVTALPDGFQVFLQRSNTTRPPDNLLQRLDLNGDPVAEAELLGIKTQILVGPGGDLYASFYQAVPKKLGIQRVAPDGTPRGPQIVLNSRPVSNAVIKLSSFGDGDFVAGWYGVVGDTRPRQVLRARLIHKGMPVGQDFDLSAISGRVAPPGITSFHLVTGPSSHAFAAVWEAPDAASRPSIHLRFFDPSGRPRTSEIVAVPSGQGIEIQAAAFDAAGNLLLLWRPQLQTVLRARLFSAATGAPLGPLFPVARTATYTCGDLAWTGDSWLITYRANGDDGKSAIVWRRFTE